MIELNNLYFKCLLFNGIVQRILTLPHNILDFSKNISCLNLQKKDDWVLHLAITFQMQSVNTEIFNPAETKSSGGV